jgi:hypothetical protein
VNIPEYTYMQYAGRVILAGVYFPVDKPVENVDNFERSIT